MSVLGSSASSIDPVRMMEPDQPKWNPFGVPGCTLFTLFAKPTIPRSVGIGCVVVLFWFITGVGIVALNSTPFIVAVSSPEPVAGSGSA